MVDCSDPQRLGSEPGTSSACHTGTLTVVKPADAAVHSSDPAVLSRRFEAGGFPLVFELNGIFVRSRVARFPALRFAQPA